MTDLRLKYEEKEDHLFAAGECSDWDEFETVEDWAACDAELEKLVEDYHNEKADLLKANQVPADLEDLDEIFYWAKHETTIGETTEADLAQEV